MSPNWSEEQLAVLRSNVSNVEAAKQLNRSEAAVRAKRGRLGIGSPKTAPSPYVPPAETTYTEDKSVAIEGVWRKRFSDLNTKYQKALHENSVTQQLVNEITTTAPKSYEARPAVHINRFSSRPGAAQSAVLLFSDTHIGQVVDPKQTLDFGNYNFDVFLARLKYLEESVISIIENHMTVEIDELVIAMLGDMLHGNLQHSVEAGQHVTLFSQYYAGGHAIAQFFRNLAPLVPKIRVKTVVGNHTRWGTQRKMPTENRFSNLDMFLYALVAALTNDIKTIEWSLDMQPFALFDVKGFVFKAFHGDHLRGGDKALGIPNHAFGREVSTTSQLFNKHGRVAPHYYIGGHLHRGIQLPHAMGEIIINGGFAGLDNYALAENFNPVDPMQRLLFMHPKYGRTAEYPLSLKFANVTETRPYELPKDFTV